MATREKMNSTRKTAIVVGVLFIIGTVAGFLALFVFAGPILEDPDYLAKFSANENQIIVAALLVLVMAFALAMVPVVMFPLFKKYNEALALGSVVFRGTLEAVCYIAIVVCWLLLLTLSQDYVKAGAADASYFQTSANLLQVAGVSIGYVLSIVFSLGALMIYYLFFQTRLIPRWLSAWGLIGAVLYLAAVLIGLFGSESGILEAPLALQEMVLAVWLIVKGFNSSAVAALSG